MIRPTLSLAEITRMPAMDGVRKPRPTAHEYLPTSAPLLEQRCAVAALQALHRLRRPLRLLTLVVFWRMYFC